MASRRLARNFVWLAMGEAATKVCTFVAFTDLGRTLGPGAYGDLELTLSIVSFLILFIQFGVGSYGARELARRPDRAADLPAEILSARLFAAAGGWLLLGAVAAAMPKPVDVKLLMVGYGLSLFAGCFLLLWFFQGRDEMHWAAAVSLTRYAAFATLVLVFFEKDTQLYWVALFDAAAVAAAAALGRWRTARTRGLHWRWRAAKAAETLRQAAPIGMANVCFAALWYLPLVVLGWREGGAATGWFGAAHRATMAIHAFVWWYFFNLLPEISRTALRPRAELKRIINRSVRICLWATVGAALGLSVCAEELLTIAYGSQFRPAGELLAQTIWAIPAGVIWGHFAVTLLGYDLQRWLFAAAAAGAVVSAGGAWVLAPSYGAAGAAWALLAGAVTSAVAAFVFCGLRLVWIPFWRALAGPAAAAGLIWPAVRTIEEPWTATAVAAVLFAIPAAAANRREAMRAIAALRPSSTIGGSP